jgi:hypothetical protein
MKKKMKELSKKQKTKWLFVKGQGWREMPIDTPTVPHTTEHGDIVQIVVLEKETANEEELSKSDK